ncbi:MAG: HD domain-containing protein [Chloroflexi bacterium]|nr:HD domain-containing protein [Chloroflexota bacterium]MBI3341287.1 HD domain-containing protein [Chloroflexota bacterium]
MTEEKSYLPRLPRLEWARSIRDPIWGDIGITEVEKRIIQTEAFTRLRGIKQLSFAYLAFPGAVHSRFEHSVGVMHATDQLLKAVREMPGPRLEAKQRQLLRLAALLHDIGHPPFSHAMENLFTYYPEIWGDVKEDLPVDFKKFMESRGKNYGKPSQHEDFTDYIICTDPEVKRVLKDWIETTDKGPMKMEDDQKEAFIKNVIAKLAIGEEVTSREVSDDYGRLSKIFKGVMSGDVDADKLDYLARDNYYCGLPYRLEVNSLRDRIVIKNWELTLLPDAIKFVNTVILARYFLITEVHQNMWDVFTTAKVVELLNTILPKEENRAQKIFEIFTTWEDARLIDYLKKSKDKEIKEILTTEYPLKEIGRLDYWDTHPYIREAIQVVSEHQHHIPELQKGLRKATKKEKLFIHINRVKSPDFEMKVDGGNLLRNEILRGISEESIKNLEIVIYGNGDFLETEQNVREFKARIEKQVQTIPEQSEQIDEYLEHLDQEPIKKLLAYLAIRRYRSICKESADENEILAPDFLLLVMEAIKKVREKLDKAKDPGNPTRQSIYKIARLIYNDLQKEDVHIRGHIHLDDSEITPSFYREIRKYEQMGLISYARKIELLKREDKPEDEKGSHLVFRFDRRFELSNYGEKKLEKMRDLRSAIPEYSKYLELWDLVTSSVERHQLEIEEILENNNHPENAGK